ncbi:MAG: GTP-binding protein, partial [Patescibacteria group bacterium]|nr:GTP-binding protein [Patescibacteria group bacterium]
DVYKRQLLDYIRKSHLTEKEFGGITQKIGAYEIKTNIKGYQNDKITFIDTPGHEAFSNLRSRGANVADIALLIIDGKDGIMPQTVESIAHIQSAKIPFIVVINKIDLPEVQPEKIKNTLLKHNVLIEEKGGKIPCVNISAKTGKGVNDLLETILLLAADLKLQYQKEAPPQVYIIETKKDKRGIVVSAIIKNGCLKIGDVVYADSLKVKIRSLINDLGKPINIVYPSTPFEILGFEKMPNVGALIQTNPPSLKEDLKEDKTSSLVKKTFDIATFFQAPKKEKKLSLIIKADSHGSLEAINNVLSSKKNLEIVLQTVGNIHKSDVFLAKTTNSIIIGFNTQIDQETKLLAKQEKILIKTYKIIYQLLEEITEVSQILQQKEEEAKTVKGEAKILATFIINNENIYGIRVTKGKINLGDNVKIYRENNLLGKTKIISLKIRAKKTNEVKKDQEAGLIFSPRFDIHIGDVVKSIL